MYVVGVLVVVLVGAGLYRLLAAEVEAGVARERRRIAAVLLREALDLQKISRGVVDGKPGIGVHSARYASTLLFELVDEIYHP